jgi:hypothetical protein
MLINKRTSDSKMQLAPAAQGVGLIGVLVDPHGVPVGDGFPIQFSVASGGEVHNEEMISVRSDRPATVTALGIYKDGLPLASVDLTASLTITTGDTLSFSPGSMSITIGGASDTMLTTMFAGPYVINEEPCLDD